MSCGVSGKLQALLSQRVRASIDETIRKGAMLNAQPFNRRSAFDIVNSIAVVGLALSPDILAIASGTYAACRASSALSSPLLRCGQVVHQAAEWAILIWYLGSAVSPGFLAFQR